jgi:tRNA (guanosine-2'-O-)-methyltransferase
LENALKNRTRYVSVLLEDIYQPHNASAVLRSCDCFGIQDVYVIESRNQFQPDKEITMGSDKWLNLHRHTGKNSLMRCMQELREQGYRIVATTPHRNDCALPEFDVSKGPFVLMFGSELKGLSPAALNNADEFLKIPMYGFTESLNISVSAAIILQFVAMRIRETESQWELTSGQRYEVMAEWLKRCIKDSKRIIERWGESNS